MEIKELRQKNDEELNKMLIENREKLRELRFKVLTNQHKAVRDVREYKTLIARIQTIQKERQIESANPASSKSGAINE